MTAEGETGRLPAVSKSRHWEAGQGKPRRGGRRPGGQVLQNFQRARASKPTGEHTYSLTALQAEAQTCHGAAIMVLAGPRLLQGLRGHICVLCGLTSPAAGLSWLRRRHRDLQITLVPFTSPSLLGRVKSLSPCKDTGD